MYDDYEDLSRIADRADDLPALGRRSGAGNKPLNRGIPDARFYRNRLRLYEETERRLEEHDRDIKNIKQIYTKAVNQLKNELDQSKKDLEKLNDNIKANRKAVIDARNKVIEPLAIVVGMFTFASIGFQIFANVDDYVLWPALLVIIFGSMVIFSGLVIHATALTQDSEEKKSLTKYILLGGLALLVGGACLYSMSLGLMRDKEFSRCETVVIKTDAGEENRKRICPQ